MLFLGCLNRPLGSYNFHACVKSAIAALQVKWCFQKQNSEIKSKYSFGPMQSDQVSMKISSKKILPAKIGTLHATVATIVRAFRNFDMIRCILSFVLSQPMISISIVEQHRQRQAPVFTNHFQEHSLSFSSRFVNLNVIQLLIG